LRDNLFKYSLIGLRLLVALFFTLYRSQKKVIMNKILGMLMWFDDKYFCLFW